MKSYTTISDNNSTIFAKGKITLAKGTEKTAKAIGSAVETIAEVTGLVISNKEIKKLLDGTEYPNYGTCSR